MKVNKLILLSLVFIWACSGEEKLADAYGYFEADRTTISAEASGQIQMFSIEEGMHVIAGQVIGQIDSMPLHYKRMQLESQRSTLKANFAQIQSQMDVVEQQYTNLKKDVQRIESLVKKGAATPKQLDDIKGQFKVLKKQEKSIATQKSALQNQIKQVDSRLDELKYSLQKTTLVNPTDGKVISRLAMQGEIANPGRPLYTVANLSKINLKAYITGNYLPLVKIGDEAKILTDDGKGGLKEWPAQVIWIAEEAEFTPKTIHTREERVNLVYAIKLAVENDGSLKIGMPGEVIFSNE
jgi:HlyD family secretion protein